MSVAPSPITRVTLEHRQSRAIARFPELSGPTTSDYAALSAYAEELPERFLNLAAKDKALAILRHDASDPNGLLSWFFRDHRAELDVAFRALAEVNRLSGHDSPWPGFDDLAQLTLVDQFLNPSYLKLCEAVLGPFLLPIAMRERRLRGKKTSDIPLHQRVGEAANTPLGPYLTSFDRTVRNAIAHGRITYRQHEVIYRDRKASQSMSPNEMARIFDDLLDLCNALAAAYRCFFLLEQGFVTQHSLAPPLQMVLEEVCAQTASPSWAMGGALELDLPGSGTQLNLIVSSRFFDDVKTHYYCLITAATAERLLPGFSRYFLLVHRRAHPAGWAAFDGDQLRTLRLAGNTDLASIATAVADPGIVIFPPLLSRWLHAPRILRPLGSLAEAIRANWVVARRRRGQIDKARVIPRIVKVQRKQAYAFIEAYIVLQSESRSEAVNFIQSNARMLIWVASLSARARIRCRSLGVMLPLGYCTVNVFLSDFRKRRLEGYGLGNQLLCRVTLKRFGRVRIVPLLTSISQEIQGCRVDWNSNAVDSSELELDGQGVA